MIERELHEAENRRALRQAEALYRRLIDTTFEGVWIFDADMRTSYVNKRLTEMLSASADEMIGRSPLDFVHDDSRTDLEQRLERRKQGIKEQYDLHLQRQDGSDLWVIACATPILGVHGEFTGSLSMLTDITERTRAEQLVRLQATALESADNAILITANDGTITWVNSAFTTLTGYSREEVLARNPRILKSGLHEPAFFESMWKTLLSGQVWHGQISNRRKDGTIYVEEETITPVLNETGVITNFIAIKQDITGRKQAEEELRWKTAFFEAQVDSALDGILVVDSEGKKILQNHRMNELWKILPLVAESQDDAAQVKFVAERTKNPKQFAEKVAYLYSHPDEISLDVVELIDGIVLERYSSPVRDKAGKDYGRIWTFRDITERKQLEGQLRQAQKMEAIGQLAGGIAHDFNNLLTVINGYSDLSIRKLQAGDPLRRNLEEIKKAGDRAATLTRQLLAFSRKQVLQPKVLDLNTLVTELEKMLRRLIGEDIELLTMLAAELGSVKADPGQIEQIVMNLVINARDVMPDGGKLTIETKNVDLADDYATQLTAITPGPYVMLAVTDTGTGMDKQTQARIFEPFFTTKEAGKGTGLGLSTVYGIVKQSGGFIWVYSEVGQGTTFKIYLQLACEGAPKYERDAETKEDTLGTETILVAEDEEMVRKLTCEVLEAHGYRVLEAANGGAALLICERENEPIDLLITDVVMPEMSGCELSDRLADLRPDMKVLYMSGYTDNAIVHQGVLDEDADFIQKPFSPGGLVSKVRKVLDAKGQKGGD